MVLQLTHHYFTNCVEVKFLQICNRARAKFGCCEWTFLQKSKNVGNENFFSHLFSFHSNMQINDGGFHLEYEVKQLFTGCGGNNTDAYGSISLPSYQDPYPRQAGCVYLITQPERTYVNISLLSLDLDCQGTPSDYIEMRDGSSEESPLMAKFCGNGSQWYGSMQTTQNNLRISWKYESHKHE